MKMTRQHFQLIATIIKEQYQNTPKASKEWELLDEIVDDFIRDLTRTNRSFDPVSFANACRPENYNE